MPMEYKLVCDCGREVTVAVEHGKVVHRITGESTEKSKSKPKKRDLVGLIGGEEETEAEA